MSATRSCTIQVFFAEGSLSTNITVPLTTTVETLRQEVLNAIQNRVHTNWPDVLSPVESNVSKVVILSDAKGVIDADCNASNLRQLGYSHDSIIRAVVPARLIYPAGTLDPLLIEQPIRDNIDSVIEKRMNDEKKTHNIAMEQKEQELKQAKSTLSGVSKAYKNTKSEIERLKTVPDNLPAWFESFVNKMEILEEKVERGESRGKEADARIKILEDENDGLKKKNVHLENEIRHLKNENKILKKEVEDLLTDQTQDWISVGSLDDIRSSLNLRQLINEAQSYLAKAAGLSEHTSFEWRKQLVNVDDKDRSRYVKNLLANCNDSVVQNIVQSPDALQLVTERRSDARKKGNKAAHQLPKKQELAPAVQKANRRGYGILLDVLPS